MKKFLAVCAVILVVAAYLGVFDEDEPQQTYVQSNYPVQNYSYAVPDYAFQDPPSYAFGGSETAATTIDRQCRTCGGSGDCPDCNGTGKIYRTRYSIDLGAGSTKYETPQQCPLCGHSGDCYKCGGTGRRSF